MKECTQLKLRLKEDSEVFAVFENILWHIWGFGKTPVDFDLKKPVDIHDAGYVTLFATATQIAIGEIGLSTEQQCESTSDKRSWNHNGSLQLAFNIVLNAQSVKDLDCGPVFQDGLIKHILEHRFKRKTRP